MAAKKPNQKMQEGITVKTDYGTAKMGKAVAQDLNMSTYEKAYHYLDKMQGTPKEGGVKRQAKPVTKSNAKGTLGSKNSRKRN
jgi:hypothetical protein